KSVRHDGFAATRPHLPRHWASWSEIRCCSMRSGPLGRTSSSASAAPNGPTWAACQSSARSPRTFGVTEDVPFEDIALVDNHAHPWLRPSAPSEPLARYFTEAEFPRDSSMFYRYAMRELGAFPVSRDDPSYARRLVEDARIDTVLLDDGYPREGAYSVTECGTLGGFRALHVARLERLAEDSLTSCTSLDNLERAVLQALDASQCVALKSIIAYRTGLMIDRPDRSRAEAALLHMHSSGATRLVDKALLDWLFHVGADWTAANGKPLHLHTDFGH